jgi:hypothetical protein
MALVFDTRIATKRDRSWLEEAKELFWKWEELM